MFACNAVEQGCVDHQVKILGYELREHGVHVWLHDEVVVERTHVLLLLALRRLALLLEILLRLFRRNDGVEVASAVALQLLGDVDGKECLAGENLRTRALEVVVDHLHAVDLAVDKLLSKFTGYINTLLHVGFLGKTGEVASHVKPHFSRLLSNLSSYGVDNDVVLAPQLLGILVNNVL